MKITGLTTIPATRLLERSIGNATARIERMSYLAVLLETDEGLVGENLIFTIRPEQLPLLDAMVQVLRESVIGRRPDETTAFWADAFKRINFIGPAGVSIMGISAIDGAMWDLRGKAAGLSVSALAGRARDRVPVYASGGLWLTQGIDEIAREAADFAGQGFGGVKLRLAGASGVDLPRIRAVREAIGPDVALMVDANQALDAKASIRLGREMAEFDIAWFEEPVAAHDLEQSALVARELDMPIASGENEYTLFGFKRMIDLGAADILMPDLQRVGGPSEFLRVGALAAASGLPISSHLFPEMSLQLMASIPNATLLEHVDWFSHFYRESLELAGGEAVVPNRPGWGFSLDLDKLRQHTP